MRMKPWLAIAGALVVAGQAQAGDLRSDVQAWRAGHERQIVDQLADFTAIPSVPANPEGLARMASRLETELRQRGFTTRLLPAGADGPPVVFGRLDAPGAKHTVGFYAHYDGQPVDPAAWRSDPFQAVMRDGLGPNARTIDWRAASAPYDPEWRLFGRAASDDKSSIVAFLAALDALKATGRSPPINIKVFWDGEEESGSPGLPDLTASHRDLLSADLWIIGDGAQHQSRIPTISFGVRGMLSAEATIYGPLRPLHSGFYGNWAPNPAVMAAEIIAEMRDSDGRILIPGFADDVRPVTAAERQAIEKQPPVEDAVRRQFALGRSEGTESLAASLMRPALNITSLQAGGGERAIPAQASMTLDFRLVPNQTPERVRAKLEGFLTSRGWTVVHDDPDEATRMAHRKLIKLEWSSGYPPIRTDMDAPASRAVVATASRAAGRPVVVIPTVGATVPLYPFVTILKAHVAQAPIFNHDNNQHAANENARLQNLWDGITTYAFLLADLKW